ncbi:MAG: hypothetical protein KC589_03090 [Nanoarchaeota archaeon]|nr:hypothetical protein [Nanoarchaeota archaeon]
MEKNNEICCPKFDPKPWNEKTFEWKNKKFIKDKVCSIFYMPINFGSVMKKFNDKLEKAETKSSDYLCLSEHTSMWNINVYLAVDKDIPNAENINLNGKFITKVYEGPYKDMKKWQDDFNKFANNKKLNIEKQYFWYTTCPKCAKKYNKNYVVIFGKIKQ